MKIYYEKYTMKKRYKYNMYNNTIHSIPSIHII